jgi:hypothetical protein
MSIPIIAVSREKPYFLFSISRIGKGLISKYPILLRKSDYIASHPAFFNH